MTLYTKQGDEIKVGMTIFFKFDIEQAGIVTGFDGNNVLVMASRGGYVAEALGIDPELMDYYMGQGIEVAINSQRCSVW